MFTGNPPLLVLYGSILREIARDHRSCLGILTMLLETTVAIVTLTAKDKVVDAFCTKVVKGTVKPPACDKAHPDGVAAYTYDDIDAAVSSAHMWKMPDKQVVSGLF